MRKEVKTFIITCDGCGASAPEEEWRSGAHFAVWMYPSLEFVMRSLQHTSIVKDYCGVCSLVVYKAFNTIERTK